MASIYTDGKLDNPPGVIEHEWVDEGHKRGAEAYLAISSEDKGNVIIESLVDFPGKNPMGIPLNLDINYKPVDFSGKVSMMGRVDDTCNNILMGIRAFGYEWEGTAPDVKLNNEYGFSE